MHIRITLMLMLYWTITAALNRLWKWVRPVNQLVYQWKTVTWHQMLFWVSTQWLLLQYMHWGHLAPQQNKTQYYRYSLSAVEWFIMSSQTIFMPITCDSIFEIWMEFWNLHVSLEHRQWDFRVPAEISLVYWWYKTMNFSLHYSIKY